MTLLDLFLCVLRCLETLEGKVGTLDGKVGTLEGKVGTLEGKVETSHHIQKHLKRKKSTRNHLKTC